ncbi:uncharacterized protein BDR25DRAFT_270225 [Lindgomyces ingoldianus]|uniref:Uncharacterized protein n=1 Tax=Lindgomyces ingoldianus TaxID=673940 RepID=A0ACB6QHF4_9PLEO|nr:uncharacterized protein BDR25DRAFT_270225 [Lindgomyces ingoldianus]KAF2465576.1 hypothetical protein BDR25DRAFT_270225 [Lindgomyces ingoldianus]
MAGQPVIWKKRILIPFWIIRIVLMLFIIVVYGLALKVLADDPDKSAPAIGIVVVFMLLIIAVLLMDILAILLFMRDALNPKTFLIMNVVQTTFWAAVLLLDVVAIARGASAVGIGFTVFVLFTFVALLIYASIGYHRQRKMAQRGNYAPAHNPAAPAPAAAPAYNAPPYGNAPPYQQNTAYYSQTGHPVELHSHTQPQGAASDYYAHPVKPAQMV